jgi:phosphatidylinositol phospholipase C delta
MSSSSVPRATPGPSVAAKLVRRVSNAVRRKDASKTDVPAAIKPHPSIPRYLLQGVSMLKVSSKKRSQRLVRLLPEEGQLAWQSNSLKSALLSESGWAFLNLEAIIELRFGADAASYRLQTDLAADVEPRWMSIIYLIRDGSERSVKMLHLVAMDQEVADAWRQTLQLMVAERKAVMTGDLCDDSERWKTWVQQCWQMTDGDGDQKASFHEVVQLCKRLGIMVDESRLKKDFQVGPILA